MHFFTISLTVCHQICVSSWRQVLVCLETVGYLLQFNTPFMLNCDDKLRWLLETNNPVHTSFAHTTAALCQNILLRI